MWHHFSDRRAFAEKAAILLICGIAYTQAPLYYSNQNQYFLHGLAQAGWGNLEHDWLANTADPTPLFSGLVAVTGRHLHEALFHVYYLLIIGLYFYSLASLVAWLKPHDKEDEPASGGREPPDDSTTSGGSRPPLAEKSTRIQIFLALFVILHAGIVRWASVQVFGVDYPWYFQAGLAGQYVLGGMFQPSVIGVLLLASILAFVRRRPWLAAVLAALAGVIHATYLLPAAFLTLAYMLVLWREQGWRPALYVGLATLGMVAPALIFHVTMFAPTSAETFAEAQSNLAHLRIPHHAEPERWFDVIALLQVIWGLIAMGLVWRTRLFLLLLDSYPSP